MSMFKKLLFASGALALASAANAQGALTERNLSMAAAKIIAETAVEKCQADGFRVTVAVVDRGGHLKALLRADGPGPHAIEIARRKALTARMFNRTTVEFVKWTEDPALAGLRTVADVISLGGGVPIRVGTELIGGVGVSGGPTAEKDEACANAGIAKAADLLK